MIKYSHHFKDTLAIDTFMQECQAEIDTLKDKVKRRNRQIEDLKKRVSRLENLNPCFNYDKCPNYEPFIV